VSRAGIPIDDPGPDEPVAGPWRVESIADVHGRLVPDSARASGRPWVVAVDGRSGAGKTTLADALASASATSAVIHTDDVAWYHAFFDWADLLADGVLAPARQGLPVSYRPPAWEARSRPGSIDVPAGVELLVVEGVGASRRGLASLLDVAVWVQADYGDARRRGIIRDGGEAAAGAFWDEWQAEEIPFLSHDRPWERAALIVAGTPVLAHDPAVELVVAPGSTPPS
jgi:hypothetical protein